MKLQRYIFRRIIQMVPVIFIITVLNFLLIHAAPGDPALALAGDHAPLEYIEELRKSYGLDQPILTQLGIYLQKLARGDLGYSYAYKRPVIDVILERIVPTLLLMLTSQILAIIFGTFIGAISARHKGTAIDYFTTGITLMLYCIPVFWTGLVLILVFAVRLKVLPSSGMYSFSGADIPRWLDIAKHMVLPVTALFLYTLPTYVRLTRSSVSEVDKEDFITTARAIGYPERDVYLKHALRNALLPTVTVAGLSLSSMFAGALLTETVFGWPGLGRLIYEAVSQRDFPILMAGFLFTSILVVVGSFITDLIYTSLDPRVSYR